MRAQINALEGNVFINITLFKKKTSSYLLTFEFDWVKNVNTNQGW